MTGCSESESEKPVASEEVKPHIKVNYWSQVNEPALAFPEGERAWPIIRDAYIADVGVKGFPNHPGWSTHRGLVELTPQILVLIRSNGETQVPEEIVELVLWLDQHQVFIDALREASHRLDMGYLVLPDIDPVLAQAEAEWAHEDFVPEEPPENPSLLGGLMPQLQILRNAVGVLLADAELALSEGDSTRASESLIAAARVAGMLNRSPFLVSSHMGISLLEQCRDSINIILMLQPEFIAEIKWERVSSSLLESVQDLDLARQLDIEVWIYEDTAQRIFSDDGNGNGVVTAEGLEFLNSLAGGLPGVGERERLSGQLLRAFLKSNRVATRAEDRRAYMAYMDVWKSELMLSPWDRGVSSAAQAAFWSQSRKHISLDEDKPIALCAGIILGAFDRSSNLERQIVCKVDATRAAIALFRHNLANKSWPTTLTDLDPAFVDGPYIDAYTGEQLLIKVIDEGPIVYSAGADRDDDDARPFRDEDDDIVVPPWVALYELESTLANEPASIDGDWILFYPSASIDD